MSTASDTTGADRREAARRRARRKLNVGTRRLARSPLVVVGVALLVLVSLALMSAATDGSARFGEIYSLLLIVNVGAIAILTVVLVFAAVRLYRQVRADQPGARLTLRMVTAFAALSVTPVLVVFGFSLVFLLRGIDSWFDVRVEAALTDALDLSKDSLAVRKRELLRSTSQVASRLSVARDAQLDELLQDGVLDTGADEMLVVSGSGRLVAFGNIDATAVVPRSTLDSDLMQMRSGANFIELEPVGEGRLQLRVVVAIGDDYGRTTLDSVDLGPEPERLLQAVYPVPTRSSNLAANVQSAFARYRELSYLRGPLKTSFVLTLSLVLFLTLLTAVWAALNMARRMVEPLRNVAEGTRAVADGDYERRLRAPGHDEIGFLVASFNAMTGRLREARRQTRHSQHALEEQRSYLQAVLGRLSSGVLTLDGKMRIHTANQAASDILGLELGADDCRTLEEIARAEPRLAEFAARVQQHVSDAAASDYADWRFESQVYGAGGPRAILCRGTVMHAPVGQDTAVYPGSGRFRAVSAPPAERAGGESTAEDVMRASAMATTTFADDDTLDETQSTPIFGHVIVFDDVTALIQAERNAAWSEVARRLAHEIKNPLTPIRLSAERLRMKYMRKLEGNDAGTLDRLTRTIEQQVDAMQGMVNAFSEYAQAPRAQAQEMDLDELAKDVVELYRSGHRNIDFQLDLGLGDVPIRADRDQLRQVLANLIKNATDSLEAATAGAPDHPARVTLTTRPTEHGVELRLTDSGSGFGDTQIDRVFEPYVTTKARGTGLGLAIVARIVEEHGGEVWADNAADGGAVVVLRLPRRPSPHIVRQLKSVAH